MNKSELKAMIAEKEAELRKLKAELKAIEKADRENKEEVKVDISIDLNDLERCNSKQEAYKILDTLKVKELKEIAKKYNVKGRNKERLIYNIIEMSIGNKIEYKSLL